MPEVSAIRSMSITITVGSSKLGRCEVNIQCSEFSAITESWPSPDIVPETQIKLAPETNPFHILAFRTMCPVLVGPLL
jgi:hypothetical protein